ncbi:MAG: hypothetical protein RLZZ587_118, partial [Actinomycetota bacterium]
MSGAGADGDAGAQVETGQGGDHGKRHRYRRRQSDERPLGSAITRLAGHLKPGSFSDPEVGQNHPRDSPYHPGAARVGRRKRECAHALPR